MRGGGFTDLALAQAEPQSSENFSAANAVTINTESGGETGEAAGENAGENAAASAAVNTAASTTTNPYITEYFADADKASGVTHIAIPATVEKIDVAFFQLLPNLSTMEVAAGNPNYSSYNGMLLDAAQTNLLLVPEGMEGAAVLPDSLATVPACVFSRCKKLSAISIDSNGSTANSAFISADGILYTHDKTTLLAAPAGLGASATIAPECTYIAEGAFQGNTNLQTIVATGNVENIALGNNGAEGAAGIDANTSVSAFMPETTSSATVVTTNKSAWEAAGFTNFAQPASPGDTVQADGFVYTLLDDYTLSVGWAAGENTTENTGEDATESATENTAANTTNPAPAQLQIPEYGEVAGVQYRVSRIAESGFKNQSSIQSVALPNSIVVVGAYAFSGCTNLASIDLGFGVTRLDNNSLENTALKELVLPNSLQYVGDKALAGLNGATIVTTHTVGIISRNALAGSSALSIYVPQREDDTYGWNAGLLAEENHVYPYAMELSANPVVLEAGQEGYIFEDGDVEAPFGTNFEFGYNANPISVDEGGFVEALKVGTSNVQVSLTLSFESGSVVLASSSRIVEVVASEPTTIQSEEVEESDDNEWYEMATLTNELGEDTVESFDYQTEDNMQMVYGTVRLSADGIATYTASTTKIMANRSNAKLHHYYISSGVDSPNSPRDLPWTEGYPAYYVVDTDESYMISTYFQYRTRAERSYTLNGDTSITNYQTSCEWSSTTSHSGKMSAGTCMNTYATVYVLFPSVTLNAGSCNGQDGDLSFILNAQANSNGASFVENNPTSYSANLYSVYPERLWAGNSVYGACQYWLASLNGISNVGWSSSKNGEPESGNLTDFDSYPWGTVYAVYPQYSVKLDNQGGSPSTSSVTARYGQKMPSVTVPTKSGYDFKGYYTGKNGTGTQYYGAYGNSVRDWDVANNSTTLYAYWVSKIFTISLDMLANNNGFVSLYETMYGSTHVLYAQYDDPVNRTGLKIGTYYDGSSYRVIPLTNTENDKVKMPVILGGEDYHNIGYYTAQSGGTQYIDRYGYINSVFKYEPITSDMTLYAQYAPDITAVYLSRTTNTGYASTAGTTSYVYSKYNSGTYSDSSCTVSMSSVVVPTTKTGWEFLGYNTRQDGTGGYRIDSDGNIDSLLASGNYYWNNTSGRATLYAIYAPIVTKVTLDQTTNEGAVSPPDGDTTVYVKYGDGKYADSACAASKYHVNKIPSTKTGWAFDGYWTTPASSSGVQLIDARGVFRDEFTDTYFGSNKEVTLYARYKRTTYNVSFRSNKPSGASNSVTGTMTLQTMTYGEETAIKDNAYSLKGWTWTGWNTKPDGSGTSYSDKQKVTDLGATTLYAQWRANTYTISFDANGGTGGQSDDVTATFDSTMPAISKTKPKLSGYEFMGWYDKKEYRAADAKQYYTSDCTSSIKFTLENNLKLYAGFKPNENTPYKVEHYQQNINDNNYTLYETENCTGTTGTTASPNPKTYTGFTKVTTANSVESGTIDGNGGLVLKFYYDRNTYVVNFVTKGSAVDSQTIRYGGKVDKNKTNTQLAGYTFDGWFSDSSCTKLYDFNSTVSSNLTLTAKFTARSDTPYKIAHYKQTVDGSYVLYQTTENHQGTTDTTATVKNEDLLPITGFHHVKNSNSAESGKINGDGTLVLRVYYDQNTYNVHFNGNGNDGGSVPADIIGVKYEQSWTIPNNLPEKTGYTYRGWQKDGTGTVYTAGTAYTVALTAENGATVTLVAKFDNNPYNIVLDANGGSPSDVVGAYYDKPWTIRADQVPHRRGYFFVGWAVGDRNKQTADYMMPSSGDFTCSDNLTTGNPASVTLYAVWQAQIYNVHFDDNGAESGGVPDDLHPFYTDGDPNVQVPVYGYAPTNDMLKKQGHHVIGWSTNPNDTAKDTATGDWYEAGDMVRNIGLDGQNRVDDANIHQYNVTLYAIWAVNTYTVIFQKNQGDYVTDGTTQANRMSVDISWGQTYTIKEWAVRGGYEFGGWENEDGDHVYQVGDVLDNLTDEDGGIVLLFAVWRGAPYRVYFDSNGGAGQMYTEYTDDGRYMNSDGVEFFYDSARKLYYTEMHFNVRQQLPFCGFWHDGYSFAGWTTERDNPNSVSYLNKQMVLDMPQDVGGGNEITLYAFWEAQVNVAVPCIAVIEVGMDGMTGYNDGLPIIDVSDQFHNDSRANMFVSATPEETYVSWISCVPVSAGLHKIFPGADYNYNPDGSLQGTNDISISIYNRSNPEIQGTYTIGSDAGYRPTSNPCFKIPANGTLSLDYMLTINRPELEMGFSEKPVQVAWLKYEIDLTNKLTLSTN